MDSGRIHIHMRNRQLTILIPVRKNKRLMTYLFLSTIPWVLILWGIVENLYSPTGSFWNRVLVFLLIISWSVIGLAGYAILSFMFFGREKIFINREHILIEKPIVFYNRRNYYLLKDISNLRAGKELYKVKKGDNWEERERSILFMDYPDKQVVFARGTSPEEAEWILLKIAQSGLVPMKAFATEHQF